MRRAVAVAIVSGLAGGGAVAAPAWARQHPQAPPAATKTVVYAGYQLRVPASWPVYRLDENPSTCVRYDVHAVYLGTPGANEKCPAWLIGRTQTVSIIPAAVVAAGAGPAVSYQRAQPFQAGATPAGRLPAAGGAVLRNTEQQELRVQLGAPAQGTGATIVATYAGSPATVEQVLASVRTAPGAAAVRPQRAASQLSRPGSPPPQRQPSPPVSPPRPVSPSPPPSPPPSASRSVRGAPRARAGPPAPTRSTTRGCSACRPGARSTTTWRPTTTRSGAAPPRC